MTRKIDDEIPTRGPFLTSDEAANYLRLANNTMMKMRVKGTGPVYRKHLGRVIYHIEDLENWSEGHKYSSTGGTGL